MSASKRADVCAVALAERFRGDGEVLGHPIGPLPTIGARLARASFEPDLVLTDGEAFAVAGLLPLGQTRATGAEVESWLPYRAIFDACWSGRRHVVMGASQLDRFGNQNIACIGPWDRPRAQLIGVRGAPGNTINHRTSYWVPKHSPRVFVDAVDFVSGVGTDRATALGDSGRFHELGGVVTDLAVLDLRGPASTLRLRSVHPGVTIDEVHAATGFPLAVADDMGETRTPSDLELELLEGLDQDGLRFTEVPG
jgi:acyl CoA:acetate/3-ketoacid CoA transferase beta subunit